MTGDQDQRGGGSGGGPGQPDSASHVEAFDGIYGVRANQLEFVARPPMPPAVPKPYIISILAAGMGMDGLVDVRGSKGVRLSAGPPPALPTSAGTNGVEIAIGETGKFSLKRGLLPIDQTMEMTADGVTIDAGIGKVTIQSMTEITLSVANGMTKIKLGPDGVTIEALQIKLSAQVQAQIEGLMNQITGSAMNKISGGITMIG